MRVTVTIAGTRIGVTRISMDAFTVAADMADIINRVTEMVVFILRSELVLMKEFVDCVYCSTLKILCGRRIAYECNQQ